MTSRSSLRRMVVQFVNSAIRPLVHDVVHEFLGSVADVFRGTQNRPINEYDVDKAIDIIDATGIDLNSGIDVIDATGIDRYTPPPLPKGWGVRQEPPPLPKGWGVRQQPPPLPKGWGGTVSQVGTVKTVSQPRRPIIGPPVGGDEPQDIDTRWILDPTLREGEGAFANWVYTPDSSNVYAFSFNDQGILYVQYRANAEPTHKTRETNECSGKDYNMAHRPFMPGPIYAYGSRANPVDQGIFERMKAAKSKGRFVWDELRICGSMWQHQYPYILVSPSMAGNILYVPRKATRFGYRVRTVPTVGSGRRPYDVSTLPGYNS